MDAISRVLLVEDNPGDARLIQEMLRGAEGVSLHVVDRLSEARARLSAPGIDVVLLDLGLPDSRGLETLAALGGQRPDLPIVVLTGLDDETLALEAVKSGAQDYLVKGRFDEDLLPRTLRYAAERQRGEAALRESEARYRSLFDGSPVGIYRTGEDGRIQAANPALALLFGYDSPDEMVGLNAVDFYLNPEDQRSWREAVERSDVLHDSEIQMRRRDGAVIWARDSGRIVRDANGRLIHYEGTLSDVTERRRAEEALRRRVSEMEALYQTSLEILARHDLRELLAAIVESVARLTGGDRGALYLPTADGNRIRVHISYNMGRDYTGTELDLGEGVSGRAAEERRTIMIEDYGAWEGRSPKFLAEGIGRILAIPMHVGERLIGVLNVADSNTGSFGDDDIRLASLFADQAAMAIESARLVSETNRRAAYLEALTSTAGALRAAVKPREMYADVLGQVVDQLKAFGATLALVDAETCGTESVLAVGAWQGTTGMRLSPGEGIIGLVTATGQTFVSDDIRGDQRLARPELLQDLPAIACVPLKVEDQIVGCVMVGRREPLSPEEVRLLTGLAEVSANAIYRMQVLETLETRVRQRTRELEGANERLMELDRMKTEFVSNVTHELRTPITNILLYLDLARRTGSAPKQSHYFDVLKSESLRLGKLIEEVLTLSRLERGAAPTDREPHSLEALLADVRVAHQARADAKGVQLQHEPDIDLPPVPIQRMQVHQVLTNLVANAVAYTPPGGQIRLRTARTRVEGREFVGAIVHNTGTYIPPEEGAHLFERFYRGSVGRGSGETGTGLGLAISKEIVELHHGWIEVESDPNTGTAFTIWLPLAEGSPRA